MIASAMPMAAAAEVWLLGMEWRSEEMSFQTSHGAAHRYPASSPPFSMLRGSGYRPSGPVKLQAVA